MAKMIDISKTNDLQVMGEVQMDCSIRPYKGAPEQKHLTLNIVFDSVPLKDVITKACSTARISWQNGPGRSKFETWKDRQSVSIDFSSPAQQVETKEEKIAKLAGEFKKAGLPEDQALEYATKAIENPEIIEETE